MANDPLGLGSFEHWASLAVCNACNELGVNLVATKSELRILANRQSNARKPFLDAARKFVPSFYRIWEPMSESHSTIIAVNKQTVKRLLSKALFLHGDHKIPFGNAPYMSPIFYVIIKECVFKNHNSYGVRHPTVWPQISLEHLAFLATLVQKVLSEWSTGVRIETSFVAENQKTVYYEHLSKLQQQRRACAVALDMHCHNLVNNARDALGSGPDLAQGPKSGVLSTSIQLWAQQYASTVAGASGSASNTQSKLSFGYSQSNHSQFEDFDFGFETQTLDETITESSFAALTQDVVASQPKSLNQTFEESPSLGDPPSGSHLHPQGIHSTPPSLDGYLNMLPPYAPPPIDVNPDTQTESEVDSYVTLRPSQSISQRIQPAAVFESGNIV
ncbi:hypothetical protein FRC07_001952 [Ceratobasidium sp. 392]|nr:hypothetical protein FRC07_001952 [Ceratobasidium sp. 392]